VFFLCDRGARLNYVPLLPVLYFCLPFWSCGSVHKVEETKGCQMTDLFRQGEALGAAGSLARGRERQRLIRQKKKTRRRKRDREEKQHVSNVVSELAHFIL